jgi:hypothetical protein
VLSTLVPRARTLCDLESLREEIKLLKDTCQRNGYSPTDIRRAVHPKQKTEPEKEKPTGIAVLPYQQTVSNRISRLLAKHHIKTVHIPKKKNIHMRRSVKDDLGLKVPGVYRIPCECGKVYVGQTGRSIDTSCKEYMRHIRLVQPENSAVAEQSVNTGHQIDFSNITILDRTSGYMDRIVKEAIPMRLNKEIFNRDNGFNLSQAWFPITRMLASQKAEPSKESNDLTEKPPVANGQP